jgi:predicted SAM-dependent methyltransferase
LRGSGRAWVANGYVRGEGIEIGALSSPLSVPRSARVKYVDRMHVSDLRRQYPELASACIVNPDILTDGERLDAIEDASQDFVIANHFLEHCQNPIGAIRNMLRVLKSGGILYLAIPDKRYSFDAGRPVTSLEHLIQDDEKGPQASRSEHFREWVSSVKGVENREDIEREADRLSAMDYSIHYHVWTQVEMMELLLFIRRHCGFEFELQLSLRDESECIRSPQRVTDLRR